MESSVMSLAPSTKVLRQFSNIEDVPFEEITEAVAVKESPSVNFLESNTSEISLKELSEDCIVPTWGNQELTISHQDFIGTVYEAAADFYRGERLNAPAIRVSHEIKGRIPSALNKKPSELLPTDKTKFYQRLAFAFTIPTIY